MSPVWKLCWAQLYGDYNLRNLNIRCFFYWLNELFDVNNECQYLCYSVFIIATVVYLICDVDFFWRIKNWIELAFTIIVEAVIAIASNWFQRFLWLNCEFKLAWCPMWLHTQQGSQCSLQSENRKAENNLRQTWHKIRTQQNHTKKSFLDIFLIIFLMQIIKQLCFLVFWHLTARLCLQRLSLLGEN